VLAVAAAVAAVAAAPFAGAPLDAETGGFILWQLRVPRTLAGAMVGCSLGLAGAVFQAVFGNPLATPSTVGTVAGATVGALVALVCLPSALLSAGLPVVTAAAFLGAITVSLAVLAVAASGRARVHDVLLAGIAVTLAANAASASLQAVADVRQTFAVAQWSFGHLAQVGYGGVVTAFPVVLPCNAWLLAMARPLQALAVSEDLAHAQGVNVARVRVMALGVGSLSVSASVAWCGPIAFVGLIVPHVVRLLVGPAQRIVLPLSAVFGAVFLVACDTIGRLAVRGYEVPVGVVTAALGAPALFVLVLRRQARTD
jgi:iron complex transport system permease protein